MDFSRELLRNWRKIAITPTTVQAWIVKRLLGLAMSPLALAMWFKILPSGRQNFFSYAENQGVVTPGAAATRQGAARMEQFDIESRRTLLG